MNKLHMPPHNEEVEQAFLGFILICESHESINDLIGKCETDFFYSPRNQRIFKAIQALRSDGKTPNLVIVTDYLREKGLLKDAGGASYLSSLLDFAAIPSMTGRYLDILVRDHRKRLLYGLGCELMDKAQNGCAPDDLLGLIQGKVSSCARGPNFKQLNSIRAIEIADLLTLEFPPRENILDPWLPTQGLAMIHAKRGVGKTFFGLNIAVAVASGGNFLQWSAQKARGVIYIDGELPGQVIQERVARIIHRVDKQSTAPLRIITPDLQPSGVPNLATPEGQEAIEPHLEGVDLVIVDSISTLCRGGRENEAESWLPIQEWALRLRTRGLSVMFHHHAGKGGQQRGTSRREDILDTVINLRLPGDYKPEDGLRVEVHFEKARRIYGDDVKPFEAKLITAPDGREKWEMKDIEECLTQRVADLLNGGIPQSDISELLGVAKGTVSKHKKKAQEQGLIK